MERADEGLLIAPGLSASVMRFSWINQSFSSLWVLVRKGVLTAVGANVPCSSTQYSLILESLDRH